MCEPNHRHLAPLLLWFLLAPGVQAGADPAGGNSEADASPPSNAEPDLRNEDSPAKLQFGKNIVAVPIPTSDPTLGAGLIGVAGYYWPQSEQQADVQPPSLTGIAGMYTDSESWALGLGQASYWGQNAWRLKAAVGYAELNLPLLATDLLGLPVSVDWLLNGGLVYAQLSRRVAGNWFVGLTGRYLDIKQDFSLAIGSVNFDLVSEVEAASLGPHVEYDSRDSTNAPQTGRLFKVDISATRGVGQSDIAYESYGAEFRSYHQLVDPLVLAWRLKACYRGGEPQLWDACRISLRGFPATDYMGLSSAMAEVEARWQFASRWGAVAFAGAGRVNDSFRIRDDNDEVPSYGVGIRWMVSEKNRLNLRLDYARSRSSDAVYLSVGEAF
jgi:hypothetical protein